MKIDPYFEEGHHVDRYYYLEEDFMKFIRYINLEFYSDPQKREIIKSIYLADLLIRIGQNIDVFLSKIIQSRYNDIICEKESQFPGKKISLKFRDYKKIDDRFVRGHSSAKLSNTKVKIIQTNEAIIPFECWTNHDPIWWTNYNEVKHRAMFNKANLDNVINALAALLILICFEKNSKKMIQYDYLCINSASKGDILSGRMKESQHDIVTKVFIPYIRS